MNHTLMLFYFAVYLLAHFSLYAIVLRRLPTFALEGVIFRYHALPAGLLACVALVYAGMVRTTDSLAVAILVVAVQGIYSLSFLELWALSAGSYSLRVLQLVATDGPAADLSDLEKLGVDKQQERRASLERLGLIRITSGVPSLTQYGQRVATILSGLVRLANLRPEE